MFTDAQIRYLEEVLGASVKDFRFQDQQPAAESQQTFTPVEVLVLTPALSEDERGLLQKILSSVKLTNFTHVEMPKLSPGEWPEGLVAEHALIFDGRSQGREQHGPAVWWSLPALNKMTGAGPQVNAAKKEAWNILQQFAKEQAT